MLRLMGAALCGVAIIFACSVPTKAHVRPRHLATGARAHSDITALSPFIGAASTYNPFRPDPSAGGKLTASGENYSANSWTAAIQTKLRQGHSASRGALDCGTGLTTATRCRLLPNYQKGQGTSAPTRRSKNGGPLCCGSRLF
jgi:hypothetical protein